MQVTSVKDARAELYYNHDNYQPVEANQLMDDVSELHIVCLLLTAENRIMTSSSSLDSQNLCECTDFIYVCAIVCFCVIVCLCVRFYDWLVRGAVDFSLDMQFR